MFKVKDYLIISLVSLLLGYILAQQFFLQQKVKKITQPDNSTALALEVSEFIKNNQKLKKERTKVNEELEKLTGATANSIKANETIRENLGDYKIALGIIAVTGPGVEITLNQQVISTQMIDLINAIKNIGAEAMAINNKRLGPNSTIESGLFYPPTVVQVIGDPELLADSLTRSGGIIDQVGVGEVQKTETITLPAI